MFVVLTFWWISGVLVYLGCLSAISKYIPLSPEVLISTHLEVLSPFSRGKIHGVMSFQSCQISPTVYPLLCWGRSLIYIPVVLKIDIFFPSAVANSASTSLDTRVSLRIWGIAWCALYVHCNLGGCLIFLGEDRYGAATLYKSTLVIILSK
jgi:hypothetical protein